MRISDWSSDVCSSDLLRPAWPSGLATEPSVPAPAAEPVAPPEVPPISSFIEAFVAEKREADSWAAKPETQNRASDRMFLEFIGDTPVNQYTRCDMTRRRRTPGKYPDHHGTWTPHTGTSFTEVLADRDA